MAKKQQIILPSLSESTKENVVLFPLTTKLEKHNRELLQNHGYKIYDNVSEDKYKLIKPSDSFVFPFLLYMSLFIQDVLRTGRFFNDLRYPYYLLFLKTIYNKPLNEKQQKVLDVFFEDGEKDFSVIDEDGNQNIYKDSKKDQKAFIEENDKQENVKVPKIVLFSSENVGTGKTETSNQLVDFLISKDLDSFKLSVMDETRDQLASIFYGLGLDPNTWVGDFYTQNKNISTEYQPYGSFKLRDLLCDYSDLLQKHLGVDVWAKCLYNTISNSNSDVVVIDDLRRDIELEYLTNIVGKDNIVTVYLTKDQDQSTQNNVNLSDVALKYQGQLNPLMFDIQFNFNSDWSNSNELLQRIYDKLV